MLLAAAEIQRIQGRCVLIRDGRLAGAVPLPIFGLMSSEDAGYFVENLDMLIHKVHGSGVGIGINPFIT